jgi:hypothetical protein
MGFHLPSSRGRKDWHAARKPLINRTMLEELSLIRLSFLNL